MFLVVLIGSGLITVELPALHVLSAICVSLLGEAFAALWLDFFLSICRKSPNTLQTESLSVVCLESIFPLWIVLPFSKQRFLVFTLIKYIRFFFISTFCMGRSPAVQ